MPRVKLFDQEEALQKAMSLFWEKGYEATSLTDLTSCLAISKSSFYATFHSKRRLFETCLNRYMSHRLAQLDLLLREEKELTRGLTKALSFTLDDMLSDIKQKGCFVANTCAELGGRDESMRETLMQHHWALHALLMRYLSGFRWEYQIPQEAFSDLLMTFVMGMNQEVKYHTDRDRFLASIAHLMRLLEA